jgi:hypothetical protein
VDIAAPLSTSTPDNDSSDSASAVEWYREEVESSLQIALLLLGTSAGGWAPGQLQTQAPSELRAELRALGTLLEAYTLGERGGGGGGGSGSGEKRQQRHLLGYSELKAHSSSSPSSCSSLHPVRLSPHEDLLLLRMTAQHCSRTQAQAQAQAQAHKAQQVPGRRPPVSALSFTDAALGGGELAGSSCFRIGTSNDDSALLAAGSFPPLAVSSRAFPRYCGVGAAGSGSGSGSGSAEEWPVARSFSGILNNVLVALSCAPAPDSTGNTSDSTSNQYTSRRRHDCHPNSFQSLLLEWQGFVFPCHHRESVEGGVAPGLSAAGGASSRSSGGGSDADLSGQVLAIAR